MNSINVVFMGTPVFSIPVLDAVDQVCQGEGWTLRCVYTSPDKPKGRGRKLIASPVKERAQELGVEVLSPQKLTTAEAVDQFRGLEPSMVILAAYGLLLPPPFLFEPLFGAINIHPSLLPKYRGAAPVAGAILEGEAVTGTSVILMDEGLDTGALLGQREIALQGYEKAAALTHQLFSLGAEMLLEILPRWVKEGIKTEPQNEKNASFYGRWSKSDGLIKWEEPAEIIERKIRAFDPWPGAWTKWEGKKLEIVEAQVSSQVLQLQPGVIVQSEAEVVVGTGEGSLALTVVKPEGKHAMPIREFILGRKEFLRSRFLS